MDLSLVTIALLVLVSGVYWAGYRTGFKASQDRVAAMFKSFSDPVTVLLDRLNASVDQAVESRGQNEPRGD